jgi:hypothetical protein
MRLMNVVDESYKAQDERRRSKQDCHEFQEELEAKLRAYRKIASEVKMSRLSMKKRQQAKAREEGVDTKNYHAGQILARIITAHECNMTQTSRFATDRKQRDEAKSVDEILRSQGTNPLYLWRSRSQWRAGSPQLRADLHGAPTGELA